MASRSDLQNLDIVIRAKNGRFLASMPQINLYASGDSATAAVDVLETKKQDLIAELTAADCLDDLKIRSIDSASQGTAAPPRERFVSYGRAFGFLGKVVVVTLAIVIGSNLISRQIAEVTYNFTRVGGVSFWGNLEKQLAAAADPKNDMPVEKKEKILSQIRIVAERTRPFIREASRMFTDPVPPNPQ